MKHYDQHIQPDQLVTLQQYLKGQRADDIVSIEINRTELTLVTKTDKLENLLTFLRDDPQCRFTQLMDLCGVDHSTAQRMQAPKTKRYSIVYHLLSLQHNLRLRLKVFLAEKETLPTITPIFSNALWYERETYDMYGIRFENHPDLRRLLTDYDFSGHPLRKDFPLVGEVETYYDGDMQRVAYKPVDLPQEFRQFDQQSPWRAMTGNQHLAENFDAEEFK